MDWTLVVSGAITGAVGVAGVAGTIISARIAGNSARESARLSIAAEADRTRHADKRQVYASFMAAFSTAQSAAKEAKSSEDDSSGRANYTAARRDAVIRFNELLLIARLPVAEPASQAMDRLREYWQGECDETTLNGAADEAYTALRADLDEDAKRGG